MIVQLDPEVIPFGRKFQSLCRHPYRRHPQGCPNFNKKSGCPPAQPLINEVLDFSRNIYLIYTEFDLRAHTERMKALHLNWSEYQIYCVLYWQPTARKILRQEEEKARQKYQLNFICKSPEANGVNVTELMKGVGIVLEWPPKKISRLVSLAGWKKK